MKTDTNMRKELGERIRERRKKLGMTQSQLCGEYMTRNMLSRIETGDANPSLETLLFIAQKLKMPPSFFLCRDVKEEAEYTKTVRIKDARRMLGTGQYKRCLDICSELPSDDDEVSFIVANAALMSALNCFDKGELSRAGEFLDVSSAALHQTVYMYSEMNAQIKLIKVLIASLVKGELPEKESIPTVLPMFFSKDRYFYIAGLCSKDFPLALFSEDSAYRMHLKSREFMAEGSFAESYELLKKAFDVSFDCYMQYFILCDLEETAEKLEDYKAAFEYARMRMDLHEKYSLYK